MYIIYACHLPRVRLLERKRDRTEAKFCRHICIYTCKVFCCELNTNVCKSVVKSHILTHTFTYTHIHIHRGLHTWIVHVSMSVVHSFVLLFAIVAYLLICSNITESEIFPNQPSYHCIKSTVSIRIQQTQCISHTYYKHTWIVNQILMSHRIQNIWSARLSLICLILNFINSFPK